MNGICGVISVRCVGSADHYIPLSERSLTRVSSKGRPTEGGLVSKFEAFYQVSRGPSQMGSSRGGLEKNNTSPPLFWFEVLTGIIFTAM